MPTLLQIDSSPLASSVSRELTREFVSNWKVAHPSGQVIVVIWRPIPQSPLTKPGSTQPTRPQTRSSQSRKPSLPSLRNASLS